MCLYFLLMCSAFFCLWNSSYFLLRVHGGYNNLLYTNYILFAGSLSLLIVVWAVNPGYLNKKDGFEIV